MFPDRFPVLLALPSFPGLSVLRIFRHFRNFCPLWTSLLLQKSRCDLFIYFTVLNHGHMSILAWILYDLFQSYSNYWISPTKVLQIFDLHNTLCNYFTQTIAQVFQNKNASCLFTATCVLSKVKKFSVLWTIFFYTFPFLSFLTLHFYPFNLSTSIATPTVAFSRICSKLSERCVSYGSYDKPGLMIYFSAAGGAKRTRLAAG